MKIEWDFMLPMKVKKDKRGKTEWKRLYFRPNVFNPIEINEHRTFPFFSSRSENSIGFNVFQIVPQFNLWFSFDEGKQSRRQGKKLF